MNKFIELSTTEKEFEKVILFNLDHIIKIGMNDQGKAYISLIDGSVTIVHQSYEDIRKSVNS